MSLEDLFRKFGKPGEADYHNNMGMAHMGSRRWDDAIREYQEAVRLRPNEVTFHCNLASAWTQQGNYPNALIEYEYALKLDAHDSVTHFNLGNLYSKLNQAEQAIQEYLTAIRLEPERVEPYYNLAASYWDLEKTHEAVMYYEKALTMDSNTSVALLAEIRVGAFYLEAKSWEKAEKFLLDAVGRKENDFMANYCLAIVYLNLRDEKMPQWVFPAKAILHIKKALEARPDDIDALQVAREASIAFNQAKPPNDQVR